MSARRWQVDLWGTRTVSVIPRRGGSETRPKDEGKAVVDGMEQRLRAGDVITIAAGCKHTVVADTALDIIEVQLGSEISASDKIKFPME